MNFINAAQRYYELANESEFSNNSLYMSALIYYQHNQFEKAVPLFNKVIQNAPKIEAAIFAAHLITEIYRLTKQYEKLAIAIREFKSNADLMSNTSDYLSEFSEALDKEEKEVLKLMEKEKSNSE